MRQLDLEPKEHSAADMQRCDRKVKNCMTPIIGTYNVRNKNEGKIAIVEQETEHLNIKQYFMSNN